MTPIARAIIGVPRNVKIVSRVPVQPKILATFDIAIKIIGMIIGARLIKPLGSFP